MSSAADSSVRAAPEPRRFGAVNWRGLWSLYWRGAHRFLRYGVESIGGPAGTSLLFLAVFNLALGGRGEVAPGATLAQFIAPGIVIFSLTHGAFQSAAVPIGPYTRRGSVRPASQLVSSRSSSPTVFSGRRLVR